MFELPVCLDPQVQVRGYDDFGPLLFYSFCPLGCCFVLPFDTNRVEHFLFFFFFILFSFHFYSLSKIKGFFLFFFFFKNKRKKKGKINKTICFVLLPSKRTCG